VTHHPDGAPELAAGVPPGIIRSDDAEEEVRGCIRRPGPESMGIVAYIFDGLLKHRHHGVSCSAQSPVKYSGQTPFQHHLYSHVTRA
jgi:hypothetical protein